ncbi:hypothetical protein N8T08_010994 [Aspergillus melleus]|uniref:Uncharacterized protein n=1 Tax=Aspergillus melleus TaxID=138277 RepID=A0ACC3AR90_9EURO|nr:hypothetical protein N8T08_010994 [Aspergillus melleus]
MVSSRDNYSDEDVASLPSESTSASDLDTLSDYSDAEEEWRESIEQLELLLTMVLVPLDQIHGMEISRRSGDEEPIGV